MARELFSASGTRFFKTNNQNKTQPNTVRSGSMPKAIILMLILSTFLSLQIARLVQLQIVQGNDLNQRAEQNRKRLVPIPSARGSILDRNGKVLASNSLSRSLYLWPRDQTPEKWQETVTQLSQILKISREDILKKIDTVGYNSAIPVRISQNLDTPTLTVLSERMKEFPGLDLRAEFNRYYPNKSLASHILGYIGEATEEDMEANPKYPMGMIVGKMGIEKLANPQLEGIWGSRQIEVDARGQEIRELRGRSPEGGAPVQLTIDIELQKTAEKALANRRGAVVVLDAKTGAVLVMASGPTFDSNLFTRKITQAEWDSLQVKENPLLNRAIQGRYPPGSTFKLITSIAGMKSGKFAPDSILMTYGSINVGGIEFHEHGGGGYGAIGFADAIAYSSNTFFYQVGMAAGPEQIAKWGHILGVGETENLDLLGLDGGKTGLLLSPKDKEKIYGEPWYAGDTVSMSIGQGPVLMTPLEEAVMIATIVNGGYRVKPHLLASQTNTPATKPVPTGIEPKILDVIRAGLVAVVQKGTGQQLNDGSIPLTGGKTGTAEVPGQPDNAMYVAYGPAKDPQIAIAVAVENGGYGAVSAVPIAHEIFKTYFNKNTKTQKPEAKKSTPAKSDPQPSNSTPETSDPQPSDPET